MTEKSQIIHISSGSTFEESVSYSRAVIADGWAFVSGTTGMDYATMTLPDSVEAQCQNTIDNIANALTQAGTSLDHVVRVRYILPNATDFEPCWPILRAAFAIAKPAATMYVAGLIDPRMKIEIEVTARMP
ncbi:RidA family protein [Halocynthiibacter namhaensis]|uniref:RidA family protein n=1 Tax=Halocynthiibacter namhaensis TaxID=1290553 RepID=UPI00057903AE|nr:RidA family protein [Halocynthiibacter namhaensis]